MYCIKCIPTFSDMLKTAMPRKFKLTWIYNAWPVILPYNEVFALYSHGCHSITLASQYYMVVTVLHWHHSIILVSQCNMDVTV